MDVPIQMSFRGLEAEAGVQDLIRRKAAKLEQVCNHITSLRVSVEEDQKHQVTGRPYRLRLAVHIPPGHEVVVTRETTDGHAHSTLEEIVRDAFDTARRRVKKISEKQQGKTKHHPDQQVDGVVTRLFPDEEYGFVKSLGGRDVYFHRNSVVDRDFDDLRAGDGVAFTAEMGDEGLQATSVHVVDRPSE